VRRSAGESPPTSTGAALPDLLGAAEPAPPARPRGSRLLRNLARVALWSLIVVGAFRGLLPAPESSPPKTPAAPPADRRAAAVAAAFLREYLTVGDDRTARAERLGRFTAAGADLGRSVAVPRGEAQYADLVLPAGSRPVANGVEVTVLAHVLQLRSGAYRDGGTLAFVVPLTIRKEGVAVTGRPRPASLPVASGLTLPRPPTAPAELASVAGRMARRAVAAAVAGDGSTLTRLGGGRPPSTRPLPSGWRVTGIGGAEVTGPPGAPTALVPVRARPPVGRASYLFLVRVQLAVGPRGLTVRQVDLGGSP
jgi:hypothetical protein